MYTFEPMTDDELNESSLIEEGIYDFQVVSSIKKISKSNNPMAELNIKVWDKEGKQHFIYDYLVFSNVNLNIRKIKHFCDATGFSSHYEKGQMPEELTSLCGRARIGIQSEKSNNNGGYYPKKNYVIDYIKNEHKDFIEKSINEISDIPF
jgi:Protein of unknown function (DUF669)